jgi:hypothetical protein
MTTLTPELKQLFDRDITAHVGLVDGGSFAPPECGERTVNAAWLAYCFAMIGELTDAARLIREYGPTLKLRDFLQLVRCECQPNGEIALELAVRYSADTLITLLFHVPEPWRLSHWKIVAAGVGGYSSTTADLNAAIAEYANMLVGHKLIDLGLAPRCGELAT